MIRAYKYRIYPNKSQEEQMYRHFGCVRFVYNWGLERKISDYQSKKKSPSCFALGKELSKMKEDKEFLREVNAQSLQMALRNLDNAYTNFFRSKKGFPKFKKKNGKQSFQCPQGVKVSENKIKLPKIGFVGIVVDRELHGTIKTTTISKTATGKYYASILVDTGTDLPEKKKIKKLVGIDVGINTFATLSTGEKINGINYDKKRLAVLQRRVSRKVVGSKNREKAKLRVALFHEKVVSKRTDFMHKLSKRLIDDNQAIAIEDLNVSGMMKNHCLAGSISNASWGEFFRMLEYKSEWYGVTLKKIGRFQPSSKICSCGVVNKELTLKDREWKCKACGLVHDRDVLASKNILKFSGLG